MKTYKFDDIYDTLCGEVCAEYAVPDVENAYAVGGQCDRLYEEMSQAYTRVRNRLGVADEDTDVEIIINNLLSIQRILCEKIYLYSKSLK